MPSKAFSSAKNKLLAKKFGATLGDRYQPQVEEFVAAKVGNSLVAIEGQLYPGVIGSDAATVSNAGRPAAANYTAGGGGVVVVSGGGSVSTGGGGAVSPPGTLSSTSTNIDTGQQYHAIDLTIARTPLTQTVDSVNQNTTVGHTHSTDASSDPDATSKFLKTNTSGQLFLRELRVRDALGNSSSITHDGAGPLFQHGLRSADDDRTSYFGRAAVGYVGHGNYAGFAHRDWATTGGYAILQGAFGATLFNAPAGQAIYHRINNSDVMMMSSNALSVSATNAATIKSDNYASQLTGWGITYAGAGDFRYLYTDELHAKAFIADLEQALAGGQIITKSVTLLAQNFTAPAPGGTANLIVKDLPSADNMQVFQSGDVIRLRTFSRSGGSLSITDCWGTVSGYIDGPGDKEQTWTFTRSASPNAGAMSTGGVVQKDAIILDYGTSGNGFHEVNAIDGLYADNSPYSQIVTWSGHPATGKVVRSRLGNLKGLFGVANEFGLFVGDGQTVTNQYLRLSSYTNEIHNLPIKMYSGSNLFMQADTGGLNYYVQAGSSFADNTSILFRRPDNTKILRLVGVNNFGSHTGALEVNAGSADSNLQLLAVAPAGYFATTTIQSTVGGSSSQWLFQRLADGTVKADFPGSLIVSNYIGVGVSVPAYRLDAADRIRSRSGSGTAGMWLSNSAGTNRGFVGLYSDSATPVTGIWNNGIWALLVDSAGKVGVGTASPEDNLHVAGGGIRVRNSGAVGFAAMKSGDASNIGYLEWWRPNGSRAGYMGYGSTHLQIALENSSDFYITGGNTRFGNTSDLYGAKIQTSGNIHAQGAVTGELYMQVAAASQPVAVAGWCRIFLRSSDNALCAVMPSGNVRVLATN